MRSKLWGRSGWEPRRIAGGGGEREAGEESGEVGQGWGAGQIGQNDATMLHIS